LGAGTQFPLNQTVIQTTGTSISPASTPVVNGLSPLNDGATLKVTQSWNSDPAVANSFNLKIPSLGVDLNFTSPSLLKGASTVSATSDGSNGTGTFRMTTSNVSYAALGFWEVDASSPNTIFAGAFITGYETPLSAMPTTGTATYGGTHNVSAQITTLSGGFSRAQVLGDANYSANFGTGSLTGTFTNFLIQAIGTNTSVTTPASATPWNNVSVSASIAAGTNRFGGSVTAGSVPGGGGGTFNVTVGTTGKIDGAFYGPAADNLAGVWSLKDSSHVVIGVATGRMQ
jgi:hypothetical protein